MIHFRRPHFARTRPSLSHVNSLLLVAIVLINGYIIAAPIAPAISFWWSEHTHHTSQKLSQQLHAPASKPTGSTPAPQGNRLVIPSMQLDAEVFDGTSIYTLNKGLWHRPNSSTPDKGGNTVIAGHRFTYTNPHGILYYLDKVSVGDELGVYWNNTRYLYKVSEVKVVEPTAVQIEDNTADARLTIYTCTPLWSPHQRLVVIAKLESKS
ncbi:MAG: sortase [Candidatus Saccharimonadales bacterium]